MSMGIGWRNLPSDRMLFGYDLKVRLVSTYIRAKGFLCDYTKISFSSISIFNNALKNGTAECYNDFVRARIYNVRTPKIFFLGVL